MSTKNDMAQAPVERLVGPSDDDMRKEALRLAGAMADRAISLVGGNGINGRISPCSILDMSACAELLQRSVDAYNDHIIKWSMRKP